MTRPILDKAEVAVESRHICVAAYGFDWEITADSDIPHWLAASVTLALRQQSPVSPKRAWG